MQAINHMIGGLALNAYHMDALAAETIVQTSGP